MGCSCCVANKGSLAIEEQSSTREVDGDLESGQPIELGLTLEQHSILPSSHATQEY